MNKKLAQFIPPISAQKNAIRALNYKYLYPDEVRAGTLIGWTRARQLSKRKPLSFNVVQRMANFERHKKNSKINPKYKKTPWKDRGYIAWLIWGGTSGINWAKSIVKKYNNRY